MTLKEAMEKVWSLPWLKCRCHKAKWKEYEFAQFS